MLHKAAYHYDMKLTLGMKKINDKESKVVSRSSPHQPRHHNMQGYRDRNHHSRRYNNSREVPLDNRAPPLMQGTVLELLVSIPIPETIYVTEVTTVNVGIFPNLLVAALLVSHMEEQVVFRHPLNGSHEPVKP